ncbi:GDSL esterase/lipase At4g10955-like isoform X2 [Nymphaea colorata]|nr:GDSL esterase/lipase At4g10955-like isoform X2 [Nymphaea colorata]
MGNNSSSSFSGKKYSGIAERADFTSHGPKHLPTNWWQHEEHQYAVAACFINGVYVLEHDRREGGIGERALAPPWWESFGYVLLKELISPDDDGIFGAIYQRTIHLDAPETPFLVLAFRGMVTDCDRRTVLNMPFGGLAWSNNFKVALEAVHRLSLLCGQENKIWLCGHSLGAAIGLLVGKIKAKGGIYLDTFLFNPPIVLDHLGKGVLDLFKNTTFINPLGFIAWNMFVNAQKEAVSSDAGQKAFQNLVKWQPRFLLNPGDFICSGYIKYYHQRDMAKIPLFSWPNWMPQLNPTAGPQFEELHLPYVTPSACLILNMAEKGAGECHGIKQWWDDDLILEYKHHGHRTEIVSTTIICALPLAPNE